MRVLQVLHDFLPDHVAGVEVYTDNLARRLAEKHSVGLLYSVVAPESSSFTLRRGRHRDIPTYEIVNNHDYRRFEERYEPEAATRRFVEVLDEFEPDVLHVQHLINLSIGIVGAAKKRGIPVVMTLHDHWLACASGGQRFHQELGRCETLDAARCGACTFPMSGAGLSSRGFRRLRALSRGPEGALPLTAASPTSRQSRAPGFTRLEQYLLNGQARPAWGAHPPSSLTFRLRADEEALFETAVSMHPDTFDESGGGVRFRIRVDGETRAERVLDPKRDPADREPATLEVSLAAGDHELELSTEAVPDSRPDFCSAGWIDPRVSSPGRVQLVTSPLARAARAVGGAVSEIGIAVQTRRIRRRWAAMRELADQVDLFISPSHYLARELVDFGLDESRVLESDYGFADEQFRARNDLPETVRRFGFVGTLTNHKGVHVLLEAFAKMPEDATLDVCGSLDVDPAYAARLRGLATHPGVRFVGGVPPDRVPSVLEKIDCLVVPSIWHENSPLTIHEAFLSGVPVVATRLGGHPGLLANGAGLLYEPDSATDLAANLRRLYDEPGLARELAARAPEVKSMTDHAVELSELYERVVAQTRAGA